MKTCVEILGHIILERVVESDPEKVEAIKNWPGPQNHTQLQCFLGFCGFYRRFIKDYSQITAAPHSSFRGPQLRVERQRKVLEENQTTGSGKTHNRQLLMLW